MKNKHDNLSITFQAIIIKWILYFIYKTNKWDIRGTENFERALADNKSVVLSCWHGQLLTSFMHLADKNYYGLAGLNKDGELISKVGSRLGLSLIHI